MEVGTKIKEIRTSKNLSQKEIAMAVDLDRGQFSRIENNKVEPNLSTLKKIAEALGVKLHELFDDQISFNLQAYDKSLVEKVQLIEQLDAEQQKVIYYMIDTLSANKHLKDTLKKAIGMTS